MSISRIPILLAACLSLTACLPDTSFFVLHEDHCLNNGGDQYCSEQDPSTPYCVAFEGSCYEDLGLDAMREDVGCVAQMPEPACWAPCGLSDDACTDTTDTSSSSSGGETEDPPTSTTEPETDTEEPSTTGPACSEAVPCLDAELPFCVDGTCSTCDASVDRTPDEACASLDIGLPLCVGNECVQCSAEDASACEGTTPLCDDATNTCVGCEFHEQCQDLDLPACNIATGACFSADAVTEVSVATPGAVAMAVADVADGAEHAIVLTASAGDNAIVVDGGKTIAIVSDGTTERVVQGSTGNPTLTVTGAGSTVYLHRLALTLNGDDVGVSVEASGTLYADSTRVAQNSGGGIELAAGTSGFLRNCMIAGEGGDAPAISSSGTLAVVYSTLGRDTNFGDPVLECSGGSATVRNSIIVSETNMPGSEVDCPGVMLEGSAEEATLSPEDWFPQFSNGDYSLNAAGGTQFADIATWEDGDPPFDFDGDDRPSTDGAADYAGADVP